MDGNIFLFQIRSNVFALLQGKKGKLAKQVRALLNEMNKFSSF